MTGLDLAAIRQRANNATKGPWEADRPQVWGPNDESVAFVTTHDPGEGSGQHEWEANAVFISHARTDIPALLDHVDALTKRVESLEAGQGVRREMIRTAITRLAAVRELHAPDPAREFGAEDRFGDTQFCRNCTTPERDLYEAHPCPTIQAIDSD